MNNVMKKHNIQSRAAHARPLHIHAARTRAPAEADTPILALTPPARPGSPPPICKYPHTWLMPPSLSVCHRPLSPCRRPATAAGAPRHCPNPPERPRAEKSGNFGRLWADFGGSSRFRACYDAGSAYRIQPYLRSNADAVDRINAVEIRYSHFDGPRGHCTWRSVPRVDHISRVGPWVLDKRAVNGAGARRAARVRGADPRLPGHDGCRWTIRPATLRRRRAPSTPTL